MINNEFLCLISLLLTNLCFCKEVQLQDKDDFDYLVYSQRWPITACAEWEEKNKENTCNLPNDKTTWTVHGIWPTKLGSDGPYFCNSAIHFDPYQLDPIIDKLRNRWVNVEANTKPDSFWKHEWDKHGTCASVLPEFDSVYNFFNQGLELNQQYDLNVILSKAKITPNDRGYKVSDINNAIMAVTNKKPMIQCIVDRKTKESLISEIRLCFNKSLELIDCDPTNPIHLGKDVLSNCNLGKDIMYYGELPVLFSPYDEYDKNAILELESYVEKRESMLKIYAFVKFLMWCTM